MKIIDVPQSGRLGPRVTWMGRNGLVGRTYTAPSNPRTKGQMEVRNIMTMLTSRFGELTDEQIDAWNTVAGAYFSAPRLGHCGPLTGHQLFMKVNSKLCLLGFEPLDYPPPPPEFPELAPQNLVITNTNGLIAIKLVCAGSTGSYTVLRASLPRNNGVRVCGDFRVLGMCPSPVAGLADITELYTAVFGEPPAGKRIFVRATVMVNGFESEPRQFTARVPVS